jgi:hypothetical protein
MFDGCHITISLIMSIKRPWYRRNGKGTAIIEGCADVSNLITTGEVCIGSLQLTSFSMRHSTVWLDNAIKDELKDEIASLGKVCESVVD